jgi:ATP-dependent protease Clp ATPase subunit
MDSLEILSLLDADVVGHSEFKKALIALVTRSRLRHFQKYVKGVESQELLTPMKILVKGASGTGKTFTVECLKRHLEFPFIRLDATQINPAGASGKNKIEDIEQMIYTEANLCYKNNPAKYLSQAGAIDRTIVFIDEFDKLVNSFKHVQSNLLTMLDNKSEFSGVSWVLAGAFVDMDEKRASKVKTIGFGEYVSLESDTLLLDDELVKAGLIPEVVGRLTYIVELDKFTIPDYVNILQNRILPKKYRDLAAYGIFNVTLTDEEVDVIAIKGSKTGQGVRYLQREVDKHFLELEFEAGVNYTRYNQH